MPTTSTQLETSGAKNARLVPVDPKVKSAKTCKLFKRGVSGNPKTPKIADPPCYDAVIVNGG